MLKLKPILNHSWFFPILMLYYGVFYIAFGEKYLGNEGQTPDGYVFASFVTNFTESFFFDTYYVYRILPSLIVKFFLNLFSISTTNSHIFTAFQILNLTSIIIACYFLKQTLLLFKIKFKNQLLAFTLFIFSFGVIKAPFYLPIMTDTFALMLSTSLLFFYLKSNIAGTITSTLLLAFTWPMGYYLGLILIAFPFCYLELTKPQKWQKVLFYSLSLSYILGLIIFNVLIMKTDISVLNVAKIDRNLLPLSISGVVLFYFFFTKLFFNKTLLDKFFFFLKLNYSRLLISVGVFAVVYLIINFLHPKPAALYSTEQILSNPIISGLVKPFLSLVSATSYFGVLICLLIIFWTTFCNTVSQMGWGIVAALGLNLYLFGVDTESRHLINIMPWLLIFLIITINKYSFSNTFYIVVALLSLVASKIWLCLNDGIDSHHQTPIDKNGTIGFPDQKLWMNFGPWMSEQMYYVQAVCMLLAIGILFFLLYRVKLNGFNKIQVIRKYTLAEGEKEI